MKVVPAPMGRQLRQKPEQAEADPPRLRLPPGAGEALFAKRVQRQRLVGHDGEAPQQRIAVEVVDRRPPGRELDELLDAQFDHGALVVEAPPGQRVDAFDVGEHVRLAQDLVSVDVQHAFLINRPRALNRERARPPQRARRRPHVLAGKNRPSLGREVPVAAAGVQPAVARNLEQEEDLQALDRPHHPPAEEPLVELDRDVAHARAPQPSYQLLQPLLRSLGGVCALLARQHTPRQSPRLPDVGQKRMMRWKAALLRVVAPLRSRLPARQPEPVEQSADQHEPSAVGEAVHSHRRNAGSGFKALSHCPCRSKR